MTDKEHGTYLQSNTLLNKADDHELGGVSGNNGVSESRYKTIGYRI